MVGRTLLALCVFAALLYWSALTASFIGWELSPPRDNSTGRDVSLLIASLIQGVIAVIAARLILRRRLMSWWLLLALPIPVIIGVPLIIG